MSDKNKSKVDVLVFAFSFLVLAAGVFAGIILSEDGGGAKSGPQPTGTPRTPLPSITAPTYTPRPNLSHRYYIGEQVLAVGSSELDNQIFYFNGISNVSEGQTVNYTIHFMHSYSFNSSSVPLDMTLYGSGQELTLLAGYRYRVERFDFNFIELLRAPEHGSGVAP